MAFTERNRPMHGQGNNSSPHAHAAETITLSDMIEVLRQRWWIVAGAALLGTLLAAIWVFNQVPHYRATAVLRVGEAREAVTTGIEAPMGESDRYVNVLTSQAQLLRSRTLIGEVVDSVGYRLRPEYDGSQARILEAVQVASQPTVDTLWLKFADDGFSVHTRSVEQSGVYGEPFKIDGVSFVLTRRPSAEEATWVVTSRERAVDRLLAKLDVSMRSETNIVDVSFDHPDPATAQQIVNTLVTRYQAFDAKFAQERAGRRRIFLEEQLTQTEASLAQAERRLTAFRNRARTYDAREELAAQQQNRLLLEIQREELDADRRMLQSMLARLNQVPDGGRWEVLRTLVSSPGLAENPVVSQMHDRLLRYRTELDSLTSGEFGNAATNPDVMRLRELIDGAEQELINAVRSHVASLDARAEARQDLAARMEAEMSQLPPQLAEEARLAQIVETYRKMADQLREDYQKAGMAEAVAVGQADIVDLASLPYKPLSRLGKLKMALGFLIGMSLGGAGAFLLEHHNSSIRRREEIEGLFQLPLLGLIPRANSAEVAASSGWRLVPSKSATNGDGNGTGDGEWERPPSPTLARDGTHAAEAYRMLRTNLLFGELATGVKSLMITSTAPREGKTITAVHLAASIAEEGPRVLLVDGDLWRGRIHELAGLPEEPGLAEMLAGEAGSEAVCSTGIPGLFVLPRGRIHSSPSSLTRSTEVRRVIRRFAEEFDVIVVDGPPVLATASGPALASVVDGVMLVIRAGRTERQAVREALKELDTVGARVVGAVLNDPSGMAQSAERQYYYSYAKSH